MHKWLKWGVLGAVYLLGFFIWLAADRQGAMWNPRKSARVVCFKPGPGCEKTKHDCSRIVQEYLHQGTPKELDAPVYIQLMERVDECENPAFWKGWLFNAGTETLRK